MSQGEVLSEDQNIQKKFFLNQGKKTLTKKTEFRGLRYERNLFRGLKFRF
jgi:hypothetical protein